MNKNRILYIADPHFGHENILWLDNRPYETVQDMTQAMIRNWQKAVDPGDTVYIIGDMFWKTISGKERSDIMAQLPGDKYLIQGNHDHEFINGFTGASEARTVRDGNTDVYLSHCPSIAFPGFYNGAVHLYGRVHNGFEAGISERVRSVLESLYEKPCRMYNAGVMTPWMDYTPRTLEEIETRYHKCMLNAAFGCKPETSRMMTLGTNHINKDTAAMLDDEPEQNNMGLSVYTKSTADGETFGWFIYIPEDLTKHPGIPDDLRRCLAIAQNHGCGVLCLDTDGPENPALKSYDW